MRYNESIIEIGKNNIRYYDEVLKISNISRTSIFRFQNREQKAYEEAKRSYAAAKERYETQKRRERDAKTGYYGLAAIIIGLISIWLISTYAVVPGAIGVIIVFVLGVLAYFNSKKDIGYPKASPKKGYYPEKYGLKIEMNSSSYDVFTAIGEDGIMALRQLQNDINSADTLAEQGTITFNMNDNRITIENNEGNINTGINTGNMNTGDYAENNVEEEEFAEVWAEM